MARRRPRIYTHVAREVVTMRVRCPYCKGPDFRVTKTMPPDPRNGDRLRYLLCRLCGRTFHHLETDDCGKNIPQGGILS